MAHFSIVGPWLVEEVVGASNSSIVGHYEGVELYVQVEEHGGPFPVIQVNYMCMNDFPEPLIVSINM